MGELGLNPNLFLVQLINFGLLVIILYFLLYKRVLTLLNERTERVERGMQEADQVKRQLKNANRDYDAKIAEARQEGSGILTQAQERARTQESEIVAQARKDADQIREEAREQAAQEREQLLREAKDQIAELVTMTASRVLREEVSSKGHDKLIQESLDALGRRN